jgi:hypothetical protein
MKGTAVARRGAETRKHHDDPLFCGFSMRKAAIMPWSSWSRKWQWYTVFPANALSSPEALVDDGLPEGRDEHRVPPLPGRDQVGLGDSVGERIVARE